MILLLSASILFLVFFVLGIRDDWHHESLQILTFISGFVLLVMLLTLPCNMAVSVDRCIQFEETEASLERARSLVSDTDNLAVALEIASVQRDVIDANKWLKSVQYWANNPFTSWFWPAKKINSLELIR